MMVENVSFAGLFVLVAVLCFLVFVFMIVRHSRWLAAFVFFVGMLFVSMLCVSKHGSLVTRPHRQALNGVTLGASSDSRTVVLVSERQVPTSVPDAPEIPEVPEAPGIPNVPEVWELLVAWRTAEELYIPNRYASMDAAAQAFARHVEPLVYQVLREDPSEGVNPTEIQVYGELFEQHGGLVETIVSSLQKAFPEIDVSQVSDRMSRPEATSIADDYVYVEVKKLIRDHHKAPWDYTQQVVTGSFETNVFGPGGHATTSLRFVEKPWVLDFDGFSKRHSRRKQFLIMSPEFANDQRAAELQSEKLAVKVLKPIVRAEAKTLLFRPRFDLTDNLPDAVRDGTFVCDQFAQQLQTPNGPVWRHAMLVDLKDVKPFMTAALAKHRTMEKVTKKDIWATNEKRSFRFGGLIALLGSVCGIYWALDTMTKGFFSGRVIAIVTVFGVVGMILILVLAA